MEASVGLAGESAGLIDEVRSARDIIHDMVGEFHGICARMGAMATSADFG